MKTSFIILILFFCLKLNAQTVVSIDFEGDGILDSAKIMNSKEGYKLLITLSTKGNKKYVSQEFLGGQENSLLATNNVLRMHNQFMRGENTFTYKYDQKLKQVKVIGYDNTQYGSASNDGSGSSSYNVTTGQYVANWNHWNTKTNTLDPVPKIIKKLPAKSFLFANFGDRMIDDFYNIDSKLMPEYLR
jgi:hypothetical protein